jgi:hypothetical protein
VAVLVPNVLDANGEFIRYGASFQSWPALPFILVGSVIVLVRLIEGGAVSRRVATLIGSVWASVLVVVAVVALPGVPQTWLYVSPAAATELAHVESLIPADAEVIVSLPVVGRFADRDAAYAFDRPGERFPVDRRLVVFVVGPEEAFDEPVTTAVLADTSNYVRTRLDARLLGSGAGVSAYAWSPPAGTTGVNLP